MIQLRPTIALKLEKLSLDGICFRISLWMLFYFTILIMSFNGRSRYNSQNIAKFNCKASDGKFQCDMCYIFTKPVQEFDLTMITQVDKNLVYEKYHNKTIQANLKDFSHIFPNMEYKLIGKSTKNKGNEDFLNCSLDSTNYEIEIGNLDNNLSLTCMDNKQSHMLQCQGYIDEIESHDYMNFYFKIEISGKNYTELFTEHKQSFDLKYQNPLYYSFRTNFQIVFLFLIIYAIYYLHSNLNDYPRQNWLKIHIWMQYLLITMFLYNLPIHLLREYSISLVHMFSNLFELLMQSSLFYFWLDMFELQLKEDEGEKKILTPWNIQKFLLVTCYTSPQVLLDFYIFLQKEINQQYDPLKEIHFYEEFKQFEIGCLIAYSIMYFYLLYKSFQQKKILIPQQDKDKDIRQHDPFVEGQEIKQEEEQIHSYKALHLLSLISFIALIYYQRNRILDPHSLTAQSTINEEALLNIYLCMIIQLYMPFQQPFEEDKNKNVYGDIELEEQGRFYLYFYYSQVDRDKLWKNIQKQINQQTHSDCSDEEL